LLECSRILAYTAVTQAAGNSGSALPYNPAATGSAPQTTGPR